MACFVAPATVAVVTTIVRKVVQKREGTSAAQSAGHSSSEISGKWTQRLGWLNTMLWGGTVMLVLDHILSGELIARPPFLTALSAPAQTGAVLREILVTGGAMTAAVFVVWGVMIVCVELRAKAVAERSLAPDKKPDASRPDPLGYRDVSGFSSSSHSLLMHAR
jgi:hypothetical protein